MGKARTSKALFKKWESANSLEQGNGQYIRHNISTKAGQKALKLYAEAVADMKQRANSDPYSWNQQDGTHGSLLGTMDSLKTKAPELGFSQDGIGTPLTEEQIVKGNTVLNNCTHYSAFWSGVIQNGNADEPSSSIPQNVTPNFLPWHRLYLQSHETVIREVLRQKGAKGWKSWALPYWDYTKQAKMPKLFRGKGNNGNSALYEPSRSQVLNRGGSLRDLLEPRSDIIPMMMQEELGKPISAFKYQQRGKENALEKTHFQTFTSYVQQVPHNNMHDISGGLADSYTSKEKILKRTDQFASSIWDVDDFADEIRSDVMNPQSTTAPGLMGLVPAAASDPVFWVHHAFIDRIWSSWNASPNASYISEQSLSDHPWNYQFFEAGDSGQAKLKTYSHWGDQPSNVIKTVYYPNYTYDQLDTTNKREANPLEALINQSHFSPTIKTKKINQTAQDLAFQTINPKLPLTSDEIVTLQKEGVTLNVTLSYEAGMNASRNVALLIGDQKFLKDNSKALKRAYTSWDGSGFDQQGIFRDVLDTREGLFSPWKIDNFQVGAINLLPMKTSMNPSMSKGKMAMPGSITVDLSNALTVQDKGNLSRKDAEVGLMIAVTNPAGQDAKNIRIRNATFSLSQSSDTKETSHDPITGSSFDKATYIAKHIKESKDTDIATDPIGHYKRIGKRNGWEKPTLEKRVIDIGESYLASNPDLIKPLSKNPFAAVDHYLSTGLEEGRILGL